MAIEISNLPTVVALDGTELVPMLSGANSRQDKIRNVARSDFMGAMARVNSDTNINIVGAASLKWNAETYDTDGFHSTVTSNELLMVPGGLGISHVVIHANVYYKNRSGKEGTGARLFSNLSLVNGWGKHFFDGQGSSVVINFTTPAIAVSSGDYFYLQGYEESDTTTTVDRAQSYFAIEVVGRNG